MITNKAIKNLYKQCIADRCPQIAASLAYASLLTLIPLTVLIYKVFSSVYVGQKWQLKVQELVFASLSPATAEQVSQYLYDSAIHASGINVLGLFMLLVSVILMMYTIDSALNRIWKINKPRHLTRRIFVYLAVLICGPLAISVSLFISTYFASLPLITEVLGTTINNGVFSWLPFVVSWTAFTMLYKWVPDCKVVWLHAFYGGTIAAFLFELAKNGFTFYVNYFPTYKLLYGALASIPLLLIWIYLTWLIVLIGAEITHFMETSER